jgi:hypothetical protein
MQRENHEERELSSDIVQPNCSQSSIARSGVVEVRSPQQLAQGAPGAYRYPQVTHTTCSELHSFCYILCFYCLFISIQNFGAILAAQSLNIFDCSFRAFDPSRLPLVPLRALRHLDLLCRAFKFQLRMRRCLASRFPMGINAVGQLAGKNSKGHNAETVAKLGKQAPEAVSRSAARGHEVIDGIPHPLIVGRQVVPNAQEVQRARLAAIRAASAQKRSPDYLAEEMSVLQNGNLTESVEGEEGGTIDLEEVERTAEMSLLFDKDEKIIPTGGLAPSSSAPTSASRRSFTTVSSVRKGGHHQISPMPIAKGSAVPAYLNRDERVPVDSAQEYTVYSSELQGVPLAESELGEADPRWNLDSDDIETIEEGRLAEMERRNLSLESQPRPLRPVDPYPANLSPSQKLQAEKLFLRERGVIPCRTFASVSANDSRAQQRHAHKGGNQGEQGTAAAPVEGSMLEPEGMSLGGDESYTPYSTESITGGSRLGSADRKAPSRVTEEEVREAERMLNTRASSAVPFGESDAEIYTPDSSAALREGVEAEVQLAESERDGLAFRQAMSVKEELKPFAVQSSGNRFGGTQLQRPPRRSYHGISFHKAGAVGKASTERRFSVKRVDLPGSSGPGPSPLPEPPGLTPRDPPAPPQAPGPSTGPERSPPQPPSVGNGPERAPPPPGEPRQKSDGALPFGFTALARTSASSTSTAASTSIDELFEREDSRSRRDSKVAKSLLFPTNTSIPAGELDYKERQASAAMRKMKQSSARGTHTGAGVDRGFGRDKKDQASSYYGSSQNPDSEGSLFRQDPNPERGYNYKAAMQQQANRRQGGVIVAPGLGARQTAAALDYLPFESDANGTAILPPSSLTASFEEQPEDIGSRNGNRGVKAATVAVQAQAAGAAVKSLNQEAELELEEGLGLAPSSSAVPPAVVDAEEQREEEEQDVENAVPSEELGTRVARNPFWSHDSAANAVTRMDLSDLTETRTGHSPQDAEREAAHYHPPPRHATAEREPRHGRPHLNPPSSFLRGTASGFTDPADFPSPTTAIQYESRHGPPAAHVPSPTEQHLHPEHKHRFGVKRSFATKASGGKKTAAPKDEREPALRADAFFVKEEKKTAAAAGISDEDDEAATRRLIAEAESRIADGYRLSEKQWQERANDAEAAALGDGGGLGIHEAAQKNKEARFHRVDLATHLGSAEPARGLHVSNRKWQHQLDKPFKGPTRIEVPGEAFTEEMEGEQGKDLKEGQQQQEAGSFDSEGQGQSMTQRIHRERRTTFPSTASLTSRGGLGFDVSKASSQQYKIAAEIAAESLRETGQVVKEEAKYAAHEWHVKERAREVLEAAKAVPSAATQTPAAAVEQTFSLFGKITSLAASVLATVGKALGAGGSVVAASAPPVAKKVIEGYQTMAPVRQAERESLAQQYPYFVGGSRGTKPAPWLMRAREMKAETALRSEVEDASFLEGDSIGGAEDEAVSGGLFNYPRLREKDTTASSFNYGAAPYGSGLKDTRPNRGLSGVRQVYLQEVLGSEEAREAAEEARLAGGGYATVEKRKGMVAPRPQS